MDRIDTHDMMAAASASAGSRSAASLCRSAGMAAIGFAGDGGRTRIDALRQSGCLRVRFPADGPADDTQAVLINTAGGLTGGDRLDCDIRLDAGARACVTTQAAEKVYRATGGEARIAARLRIGGDALLEWLPQETILFDGARLRRDTRVELGAGGRLLAHESVVFGRRARGEEVRHGLLRDGWRIYRAGRLVWADTLRLAGDMARALDRRAVGDGARAVATLLYATNDAASWLGPARRLLGEAACRAAATAFDGLLVIRMLDREPHIVRRAAQAVLAGLRAAAEGLMPVLPRVWAC